MAISLNDGNSFHLSLFVDDDIKFHTPLKSRSPRRVGIVRIRTVNAFNAEMAKPLEGRHVILKWRDERNQQLRKHQDPEDPEALVRAPLTGAMRALHVLADDLYQLAHALEPPLQILALLRDLQQFQGGRYEILTASLFARCGFEIEFIEDSSKRNPEFIAEKDGERIAVEAKSRHRAGVLNERGAFRETRRLRSADSMNRLRDRIQGTYPL